MKKLRVEEERNPAPTTSANTLLIRDEPSCTVINSLHDEDENSIHGNTDIYYFAFTIIDSNEIKTQPLINTQQIILSEKSHGRNFNPNWILLDSQSTINIFNNKNFFKYIRKCKPQENVQ